ncbi:MAG: glycine cleavage system aminomethyltransferase GcvT [Peptococcales bacterium]|jgi:aminomethyltransferase
MSLKRTPLYQEHVKCGGKIVEFGGFEMPVQYKGIIEEHNTVRQKAGLFDVSHMGEILVKGPEAKNFIQKIITNNMDKIEPGKIIYSPICYENGGTIDDLLVYCFNEEYYWLVVNASNTEKDWQWINEQKANENVELINISSDTAQLALQGPKAQEILQLLTSLDLSSIKFFRFLEGKVAGSQCVVSRTGYTGEDGFEIYLKAGEVVHLWQELLSKGEELGLAPIGLGARDTLRFEAGLPLYGHELGPDITPLEAGLGIFVDLKSDIDYIGKEALLRQKTEGLKRMRVGIEMVDRGIPREGYLIHKDGEEIGVITSGSFSPTLGKNLGMALIKAEESQIGNTISIMIRNKPCQATIVKLPFYSR